MAKSETIKERLERAADTVSARPAFGQRVYSNTATIEDGLTCRVTEKGHTMIADVPKSMGGEDGGPSPSTVFRSALTSCIAMGIKMWAARRRVPVDRIEVSVETDVDARGQLGVSDTVVPGFENIRLAIHVDTPAPKDVIDDIVATSMKFSPLMDALENPQSITTTLVVGEIA